MLAPLVGVWRSSAIVGPASRRSAGSWPDRSQRTFLDADLELEARAGRSVSAIFAEEGEPVFRDWEERTLAELIEQSPTAVIATGGGAVLREANRRRLRDFGFVVWLTAEPAELACRLRSDPRGLAARPAL